MAEIAEALGTNPVMIKDLEGKEHRLFPLRFSDLADLEVLFQGGVSTWGGPLTTISGQIGLLWVHLRREGLTKEKIKEARSTNTWPISINDVGEMFDMTQLVDVLNSITKALKASGFEILKGDQKPPLEATEATPSGTSSSLA